jgi:uncharacterized membrane protein YidH (DUF202 family)
MATSSSSSSSFDNNKRKIVVHYNRRDHSIAWFAGTSDAVIRDTIKESLGISPESNVVLRDDEDTIIAINQFLPSNSRYHAEERSHLNEIVLDDPKAAHKSTSNNNSDGGMATTSTHSFRGELLKFERINAHLANERTWLAWVRTALSTLSCAFAFLSLSTSGAFKTLTYALGCLFCMAVIFVYWTGWSRYSRVKVILGLSFSEM